MENMQELYNKMARANIINDPNYLKKLLDFYKNSGRPHSSFKKNSHRDSDFYDFLVKTNTSYTDSSNVDVNDYQSFYVKMTNNWISNILSLNSQQLQQLSERNLGGYSQIKNILKTKQKVDSVQEIKELYDRISDALGDEFAIENNNYFWRHCQSSIGFSSDSDYAGDFIHVNSRYGKGRQEKPENVDYRLYINCANKDLFKIANAYVDYCEQNGMYYYFKFMAGKNRQDKLLLYSSKEQLGKNIAILKQIAKDNPSIVSNCGPNLPLTGNIDNWIGIASEPDKNVVKDRQSFNTLHAEILEDSAEKLTLDFINDNINNKNVRNELINRAVDIVLEEMCKQMKQNKENISQEYISSLRNTITQVAPTLGMRPILKGFQRLKEVMPEKNSLFVTNDEPIFIIRRPDGADFNYSINVSDKILKSMVDVMEMSDPNYLAKYNEEIKKRCQQYAVDPNNFSLNSSSLEDFKRIDNENVVLQFDDKSKSVDNGWNTANYEYVCGILSMLPSEALTIKVATPMLACDNLSLEQYAQEYVTSRMDKNKNFITESGEFIPVNELIKSLVSQYYNQEELTESSIEEQTNNNQRRR